MTDALSFLVLSSVFVSGFPASTSAEGSAPPFKTRGEHLFDRVMQRHRAEAERSEEEEYRAFTALLGSQKKNTAQRQQQQQKEMSSSSSSASRPAPPSASKKTAQPAVRRTRRAEEELAGKSLPVAGVASSVLDSIRSQSGAPPPSSRNLLDLLRGRTKESEAHTEETTRRQQEQGRRLQELRDLANRELRRVKTAHRGGGGGGVPIRSPAAAVPRGPRPHPLGSVSSHAIVLDGNERPPPPPAVASSSSSSSLASSNSNNRRPSTVRSTPQQSIPKPSSLPTAGQAQASSSSSTTSPSSSKEDRITSVILNQLTPALPHGVRSEDLIQAVSSAGLVDGPEDQYLFRALLRRIAKLTPRASGGKEWVLRPQFHQ